MRMPNFFIVGAPKCGTTSLNEYLKAHARVFVSTPKEPFYFCTDFPRARKVRSEADYLDLFQDVRPHHSVAGEASAVYLYSQVAIERIHEFNPAARLIVMLRNPLELVPSLHAQLVFGLHEDEPDFGRAWHLQSERAAGKQVPPFCLAPQFLDYRSFGLLGRQLERLMSWFPREQVMLLFYEDFSQATGRCYQEVLQFLRLPDDGRQAFPRLNRRKVHRSSKFAALRRLLELRHPQLAETVRGGVKRLGLEAPLQAVLRRNIARRPLSPEMRQTLHDAFAEDIGRLADLSGRDLSHWLLHPAVAA